MRPTKGLEKAPKKAEETPSSCLMAFGDYVFYNVGKSA
jgi:hypothetical protein